MKTRRKSQLLLRKSNKLVDAKTKHVKFNGMNGAHSNDSLQIVKRKTEQEIRDAKQKLLALEAKLRTITELEAESKKLRPEETPENKYAQSGTTEAVLDAIQCLWRDGKGTARGVLAAQIRDFMLAHGFNPNCDPSNFSTAVGVTLGRLAGRRIECVEFAGKNYYRPLNAHD